MNYEIKKLSLSEAFEIYNRYMVNDFPKNELKPWIMIKKLYIFGKYDFFGFFENDSAIAYAFFQKDDKINKFCLLDYFAVKKELRGNHIGSNFLKLLLDNFFKDEIIIVEAENPAYSEKNMIETAVKRISFYKNLSFVDSDVKSCIIGVHYVLLCSKLSEKDTLRNAYLDIYGKTVRKLINFE